MQNWPSNFQLLSFQSSNFQFCHFSPLSINFCQCSPPLELSYFFLLSDQNYTVLTFILIIIFIVKRKLNKKAVKKKKTKNMLENMSKMANANPEGIDEVRMSWNVWTWTKVEASKCVIPLAASISPICPHPDIPTLRFAAKLVPLFSTLTLASSSSLLSSLQNRFSFSCSILAWSRRRWAMSNRLWGMRHAIGLLPENTLVG